MDQKGRDRYVATSGVLSHFHENYSGLVGLLDSYRNLAPETKKLKRLARISGAERSEPIRPVPGRARQLREAELDQLVALYEAGKSMVELVNVFRIHRSTIAKHLLERGVTVRTTAMTEAQIDDAVLLYQSGLSFMKIGSKLGFNPSTITTHVRRRGVKIRGPHERRS